VTVFFIAALVFVVVAVAIVLRPLIKSSVSAGIDPEHMNRDVLRDQFEDIEHDVRAGVLDPAQAVQARQELERRVLEEVTGKTGLPVKKSRTWGLPIAIAVTLPVAALGLYLHLGNPEGLSAIPHAASNLSSISPEQFGEMTAKLAARLQEKPDDVVGWTMLGRAYRATERHEEAAKAFARASALKPDDAELLADQAESLAISRGRNLAGEPTRLLDRALKLDPDSAKALALAGSGAFERKDYKAAIGHWERLLKQPDIGPELAQALQTGIIEARALAEGRKPTAPPAAGRVSGVVSLNAELKGQANPEDAVFVFARAAQGPRMPLAIAKVKVKDLPYHFELDDSMAMMPELKISGFAQIVVGARVSKSGSATPSSGDLEGIGPVVKPGASGVKVSISQVVK
jgi:cytochrome c-type biogenesis protein CcmH